MCFIHLTTQSDLKRWGEEMDESSWDEYRSSPVWIAIFSVIWCFMSLGNFLMTLLRNMFTNIVISNLLLVHPLLVYFASEHSVMKCCPWMVKIWMKINLMSDSNCNICICIMSKFCTRNEKERKKDVATGMKYGVASFSSWSKSTCNPKTCMPRIREPPTTTASFWRWTPWTACGQAGRHLYAPKGQTPRFPHGWLEIYFYYDWMDHRW